MNRGRVCLVFVLLALSSCAAEARRSRRLRASAENRRTDFDFFFLVRQWPATFCNDHYCTHRPPKKYEFTLHGMWPQRRDGTWPEFCDPSSHLDVDQLDDLMDDMEHDWPSWSSADETFWDHEWNRHGTCSAPVTGDQHRYFQTVLALHHKLNLQDALSAAGIQPSNSKRYPVQDIKDAIEAKYGVMPHVTCDGKGELSEIWMCINKKLRVIDCVEDPRPPHGKAAAATATGTSTAEQVEEALTSAPAPPNYNCNMVMIPKLQKHWGKMPGLDAVAPAVGQPVEESSTHHHHHQHHHDQHHEGHQHHHQQQQQEDAAAGDDLDGDDTDNILEAGAELAGEVTAELAAAMQPLLQSAAGVVQELAAKGAAAADSAAAGLSSVAASLTAVQQAASGVAVDVTVVVDEAASDAGSAVVVTEAAEQMPVVAVAAELKQQQEPEQAQSSAAPDVAVAAPVEAIVAPAVAANLQQQTEQPKGVAASAPDVATVAPAVAMVPPAVAVVADKMQQNAVATPNKHLPVLAGVVVAVVAAAVVAAAVALKAVPCRTEGKTYSYVPPCIASPEPILPREASLGEASPLLAVSNKV